MIICWTLSVFTTWKRTKKMV